MHQTVKNKWGLVTPSIGIGQDMKGKICRMALIDLKGRVARWSVGDFSSRSARADIIDCRWSSHVGLAPSDRPADL